MASKIIVDQLQKSGYTALTLPSANATANQILKNDGAGALSWATDEGAPPKIGQVVQSVKTDTFTTASSAWIDIPDLSVAIQPTSVTSKVLVFMNVNGIGTYGASGGWVKIVRDSTDIAVGDTAGSRQRASNANYESDTGGSTPFSTVWLDNPGTTSIVTYKVQGFAQTTHTFYVNRTEADTDMIGYARTVSTITVMEYLV